MLDTLWSYLFPPVCPHCGTPVAAEGVWCESCYQELLHIHSIDMPWGSPVDRVWVLAHYDGGIKSILHDIKFNHQKKQSKWAASFLQSFSLQLAACSIEPDIVVPVPSSDKKIEERGYNQVDILFKEWVRELWIRKGRHYWQWCDCLTKIDTGKSMWELTKNERSTNVLHTFRLLKDYSDCSKMQEKNILIVDDIYTTGATIEAVATILKEGGAHNIQALTLASGSF